MINPLYEHLARPTIEYCETNLSGFVAQPANAFSSLIISLAGVYILLKKPNHYTRPLGLIAVIIGLSSCGYYVTNSFIGQVFDFSSMFLLASYLLALNLSRMGINRNRSWLTFLLLAVPSIFLFVYFKTFGGFNIGIPIFALQLIAILSLEIYLTKKDQINFSYFSAALISLGIGLIVWILDYKQIWCDPSYFHIINGHALWHLSNAISILYLAKHYEQLS